MSSLENWRTTIWNCCQFHLRGFWSALYHKSRKPKKIEFEFDSPLLRHTSSFLIAATPRCGSFKKELSRISRLVRHLIRGTERTTYQQITDFRHACGRCFSTGAFNKT